jgi:hypothetical protein
VRSTDPTAGWPQTAASRDGTFPMSSMYAFQVRWAESSSSATECTVLGKTQPDPLLWPPAPMVVPAGKSAITWQSAWLLGFGAWPEMSAM